jgi:hypothetical protein
MYGLKQTRSVTIAKVCALAIVGTFSAGSYSYADHWPIERVIATQKAYANLPYKNTFKGAGTVHYEEYGDRPSEVPTANNKPSMAPIEVQNPALEKIFDKPSNIAALVLNNGKLIFERYHPSINSNRPIWGTSIAKTATATAVGKLLCSGKIKSLDDQLGKYSPILADTVYSKVTIRNALQMRSGVSKNRNDEDTVANKAKGILDQQKFGTAKQALLIYEKPYTQQGTRFSYHVSDTLALSLLVQEITGSSLGSFFYNNVMTLASSNPYIIWITDKNGTTVGFGDLVMPARDWLKFGNYLMQEMKSETCLGSFFNEGMKSAVTTGIDYKKYGFHSWVYATSEGPMMALQGHFGNLIALDKERNAVLMLLSSDSNYGDYKIGRDSGKIMDRLADITE